MTINEKASSRSQGIAREQKNAVKKFDRSSQGDESTESTSQAATAQDIKTGQPRNTENKPASKPAAAKREQSDIFKSFSKPRTKLKKEDTSSSTSASPAPNIAHSVSSLSLFNCN